MWWQEESLISLTQARNLFPEPVSESTIWRYVREKNRYGQQLETVVLGCKRRTSRERIAAYIERCTAAANGMDAASNHERVEKAEAQLEALGL